MRNVRKVFVVLVLAGAVASLSAQTAGQKPKPFEPQSGQSGKDVVWVPTPQELVDRMLDMAKVTPQDIHYDLGSGDGRTVISAAKRGARAFGIEYNPDMVDLSRRKAAEAGVTKLATFTQADLFETDFSKADVLTLFLLPGINMRLRPVILSKLKPGSRVVSNTFTMEDWEEDEKSTVGGGCVSWCTAYMWIVPAQVEGTWTVGNSNLTLTQKFQNITGTLGTNAISAGKLRGAEITFNVGDVKYTGRVNGNTISGTMSGSRTGSWSATKKPTV
jgi:precorrin-6B methylase 2